MKPWVWVVAVFFLLGAAVAGLGLWAVQMQRMAAALARETAAAGAAKEARAEAETARAEAEGAKEQKERENAAASESAPGRGAEAGDESFQFGSIKIDGLGQAGLSAEDLAGIEIEIDAGPAGLGRPGAGKVAMGRLMSPVSPLRLSRAEVQRMSAAVVDLIKQKGFIGIFVDVGGAAGRDPGAEWRWTVHLASIARIEVQDRRTDQHVAADLTKIRSGCPLREGDHLIKRTLDEYAESLRSEYGGEVNVMLAPSDKSDEVVVTFMLGPAGAK